MQTAEKKARDFCENEREFHLGAMPTEQSNPKTRTLSRTTREDTAAGVRMLQSVDFDLLPRIREVFAGAAFELLVEAQDKALRGRGRIFFVGCGATGRLCILLEAIWRRFWQDLKRDRPETAARTEDLEHRVFSVMTGGDHALIRSVEGFEDFTRFGVQQLDEAGVRAGDVVIAITEGGETSFVIGAAWCGLRAGADVFFMYNNPSDVLAAHVQRSREVIEEPRMTKLDLSSGPMAVAGSTRMQATTSELLVAVAALELGLRRRLSADLEDVGPEFPMAGGTEYASAFEQLLADLARPAAVEAIARMTEFEETVYSREGLLTYMADDFLLDILTDTTERAPTFRLPPFRKCDDRESARSWAFVKNPTLPTAPAWERMMRRPPRGLDWDEAMYRRLGVPADLQRNHPKLNNREILKFRIGCEDDASRYEAPLSAAALVLVGAEVRRLQSPADKFRRGFEEVAEKFDLRAALSIGEEAPASLDLNESFHIPCRLPESPFNVWEHLAIKLVMNTVSTATMARMGRLTGNLMVCVETTNKKLIDRGTRLIAEVVGLDYEEACRELFATLEGLDACRRPGRALPSPVALTIQRLREAREGAPPAAGNDSRRAE